MLSSNLMVVGRQTIETEEGDMHRIRLLNKRLSVSRAIRHRSRLNAVMKGEVVQTMLVADVPCVECSAHGVVTAEVPWAEPGSAMNIY